MLLSCGTKLAGGDLVVDVVVVWYGVGRWSFGC